MRNSLSSIDRSPAATSQPTFVRRAIKDFTPVGDNDSDGIASLASRTTESCRAIARPRRVMFASESADGGSDGRRTTAVYFGARGALVCDCAGSVTITISPSTERQGRSTWSPEEFPERDDPCKLPEPRGTWMSGVEADAEVRSADVVVVRISRWSCLTPLGGACSCARASLLAVRP